MRQVNLKEAETSLAELIEEVAGGAEIILTRDDGASFKIVPIEVPSVRPKFGSARGLIKISDDFDDTLEDFQEYTP